MAAISLADCQVHKKFGGEFCDVTIITPATADSDDTIDISSLVQAGQLCMLKSWNVQEGNDAVAATYDAATGVVTLDPGAGDTDDTFAINIKYVGYDFAP